MAERVRFRGGLTCSCVAESLPLVEADLQRRGLLKGSLRIFQLGYRSDVSASAGTHARGGCVDLDGTPTSAEIDVWRLWGWTMQARFLSGVMPHCHGWPYRCPHLSPAAQAQERDWDRKDAGLQGVGKVSGRWPIKPWNIALRERKPLFEETKQGVPIMADAKSVRFSYSGGQALTAGSAGRIQINDEKHTSVVVGESDGVDVTASVAVEGLKEGEFVHVWWRKEWKKTGSPDQNKGSDIASTIVYTPDSRTPATQTRYADRLAKADSGWTACLRLMYLTNSETAKVARLQIRGWKLEA